MSLSASAESLMSVIGTQKEELSPSSAAHSVTLSLFHLHFFCVYCLSASLQSAVVHQELTDPPFCLFTFCPAPSLSPPPPSLSPVLYSLLLHSLSRAHQSDSRYISHRSFCEFACVCVKRKELLNFALCPLSVICLRSDDTHSWCCCCYCCAACAQVGSARCPCRHDLISRSELLVRTAPVSSPRTLK